MSCPGDARLEAWADGELPVDSGLEVREHVEDCAQCAEALRLHAAMRGGVRRLLDADAALGPEVALRRRVAAALAVDRAEEERAEAQVRHVPGWWSWSDGLSGRRWRGAVTLAAAAVLTLAWLGGRGAEPGGAAAERAGVSGAKMLAASVDPMGGVERFIENLVAEHAGGARAAPADETSESEAIEAFEPLVGLPLRRPRLASVGASWLGARLVSVEGRERAVHFRYHVAEHRVTVAVFDPERVPLRARLEPRVVRMVPVFVGQRHGYSIASVERAGVGYVLATDLPASESAEIAAATIEQ